jgi:hypothetical protein
VGLLEFDGYYATDITRYESTAGLPSVTLSNVLLGGFNGAPGFANDEVALDIEMTISMAPGLSQVIVYEGPNDANFSPNTVLNRMATDNLVKQLSSSWGWDSGTNATTDQIFLQMAAQGQSMFQASGDSDAYVGLIDAPSDDPYITIVGGTTLTTSGPGGAWVSETTWNWGGGIGTGGGISPLFPLPVWQQGVDMTGNQGSTNKRNLPDVALTADNVWVAYNGGGSGIFGGTSCAAPLWAGFTALVNQQAQASGRPPVGFVNPAIYAIGQSANLSSTFHDISTGNNTSSSSPTRFYAVSGYDLCTGWGTPAGSALINALAVPDALAITPGTGFSAIGPVGGPFTPGSRSYSLTNGGTNTISWSLVNTSAWLSATVASGTLAPGGQATTVVVSVASAATNLALGTYNATLFFSNLTDRASQSLRFSLAALDPPVIIAQPADQAVLGGATATFTVGANGSAPLSYRWWGNGAGLSDGGNISGSAASSLVVGNTSAANAGAYFVVVSNAAATTTSVVAHLSITPTPPVIVWQPSNQTVLVGETASFAVGVQGTPPFAYQWTFNTTNLAGATNPLLTLTNAQFSQAGSYSVRVTNAAGLAVSSNAVLTVQSVQPDCAVAPAGLVSWWRGEGTALDAVGGNNGSLVGNTGYASGKAGLGFALDGRGSGVTLGDPASLQLQNFTIEAWIKRASATLVSTGAIYDGLIFSYGAGGYGFGLTASGGRPLLSAIGSDEITAGAGITDTNFHHVAVIKSGTAVNFYIDGAAYSTPGYFNTFTFSTPAAIGATGDTLRNNFLGMVDEASIYNRALTASEIQAIYMAGSAGKCLPTNPPAITQQPTNQVITVGGSAIFALMATGSPPLSYQWQFNGTNVAGATNNSLVLSNVQQSQAGNYAAMVTNEFGSVLSSNALLSVTNCAAVPAGLVSWWRGEGDALDQTGGNHGSELGNVSYESGEVGLGFVLGGSGAGVSVGNPLNLQLQDLSIEAWVRRASTSQVSPVAGNDALIFSYGSRGYGFGLRSSGQPVFGQIDVDSVSGGAAITDTNFHHLAVTRSGTTVVFYVDGAGYPQPPYSTPFLFLTTAAIGVRTDNSNNSFLGTIDEVSVYSRALAASEIQGIYAIGSGGKCVPKIPPSISTQPTNQTVIAGSSASFTVSATGAVPLSYQWQFNGGPLAGQTNATLALSNLQTNSAGNYTVLVTNLYGSMGSSNAALTVLAIGVCAKPAAGMVAWWRADGNALDAAGGDHGTLVGNAAYGVGEVGQGFLLDGRGSGVAVGYATNLQLQNLTIESWVRRASATVVSSNASDDGLIFSFGNGGYGFGLGFNGGQPLFSKIGTDALRVGPAIGDTNFHHLAVTKSGVEVVFYVDGAAYPAPAYESTFSFTTPAAVGIKGDDYRVGSFWGMIDEVSVYNRALSAPEVQAIYAAGRAGKCIAPPVITEQPVSQRVAPGCNLALSVAVSGAPPLIYQWWKDGTPLSGQTSSNLTFAGVQTNDIGGYYVMVTNSFGFAASSNAVLTQDQIPVAGPATVARFSSGGVRMKVTDLLTNGTDPDGDMLTLIQAGPMSTAGGNVSQSGDWVYYTPPAGYGGLDAFGYTVSDGYCGGTASALVTVQVKADNGQPSEFAIRNLGDGSYCLAFSGIPGLSYRVQWSPSLPPTEWQDLVVRTADMFGAVEYTDQPPANAQTRYYRCVTP